jgi:RNA-directed DNA polymerase
MITPKASRTRRRLNIRTLPHLSRRLNVRLEILEGLSESIVFQYGDIRIPKKDGKSYRTINAPRERLIGVQSSINENLLAGLWLPESIHGSRTGRSTVTATAAHRGRPFWWQADIKDFYPSISANRVYDIFIALGCAPDVARLLTRLTTYDHRVPQGAPTSSSLANLYLRFSRVAQRLEGLARTHGLQVTFYGDDILVSGDEPFMGLQAHMRRIIESCGLRLHPVKTQEKVVGPDAKHAALGLVTNSRGQEIDVPKSYRRRVRTLLRLCQRYGPGILVRKRITRNPRAFLLGKISYAIHINPRHRRLLADLDRIDWSSDGFGGMPSTSQVRTATL